MHPQSFTSRSNKEHLKPKNFAMSGQWGTGLFNCLMDTTQCLDTCFCGPCSLSRQWKALDGVTNQFDLTMCLISSCCGVCVNIKIRMRTVEKYGIDEAALMNVIFGWCCGGCSACQTHRELTLRNAWPGGNCLHKQPGDYTQMK